MTTQQRSAALKKARKQLVLLSKAVRPLETEWRRLERIIERSDPDSRDYNRALNAQVKIENYFDRISAVNHRLPCGWL